MKKNLQYVVGILSCLLISSGIGCTSKQFYESIPADTSASASGGSRDPGGTIVTPVSGEQQTEEFTDLSHTSVSSIPQEVQMLFVIDNSGSMSDEQTNLANQFAQFADQHLTSSKLLTIGRTTTDSYLAGQSSNAQCTNYPQECDIRSAKLLVNWADGMFPRSNGAVGSTRPILKTNEPPSGFSGDWITQIKQDFKTNVNVGVAGSGVECGLASAKRFIEVNEQLSSCSSRGVNDNKCLFSNPNAIHGIVMFSDENEDCIPPGAPSGSSTSDAVATYMGNYYKGSYDSFFKSVTGTNDPKYFLSVIVNQTNTNSDYSPIAYNKAYNAVKAGAGNSAAQFGRSGDIESSSYVNILDGVASAINSTQTVTVTSFTLSAVPDSVANVVVKVVASNGSQITIPNNQGKYILENGNVLRLTFDLLASYPGATKLLVNYVAQ